MPLISMPGTGIRNFAQKSVFKFLLPLFSGVTAPLKYGTPILSPGFYPQIKAGLE